MVQEICLFLVWSIGIYFLSVNLIYAVLMLFSWLRVKTYKLNISEKLPAVTFLVPAYNEESLIVETIQTYLSLTRTEKEIIIVNDGSHDNTMRLLKVIYQLRKDKSEPTGRLHSSVTHPELKVIEAPHMGKASALNFGLRYARHSLICTLDADTIPTTKGVEACLAAFVNDPKLMAAGGVIQVLEGQELKNNFPLKEKSRAWLTSFQRVEYLRTFVCERLGWSFLGSTILISGAFCMIKKEAIERIGGFSPRSITEDFDLIVRLRRSYLNEKPRFEILPVTTCYTQAPRKLRHLSRQRMRWQMGLVQTLFQNGSLFFHPKHGCMGMMAVPYFWLVEVLSPLMSLLAYIAVAFALFSGWLDLNIVLLYFGAGIFFNLLITLFGLHLDQNYVSGKSSGSVFRSLRETFLMNFGYKQLNSYWRLLALIKSMTKSPGWGEKPRVELIHRHY